MSIYQKYCKEVIDENGFLRSLTLDYPENFNFGYDVVDAIAETEPKKRALVWCNTENEEQFFSFADIKKYSNKSHQQSKRNSGFLLKSVVNYSLSFMLNVI